MRKLISSDAAVTLRSKRLLGTRLLARKRGRLTLLFACLASISRHPTKPVNMPRVQVWIDSRQPHPASRRKARKRSVFFDRMRLRASTPRNERKSMATANIWRWMRAIGSGLKVVTDAHVGCCGAKEI